MDKIPVAILGATGLVGQKFIELLQNHPWFEVAELVASERSSGKKYSEALQQAPNFDLNPDIEDMVVKNTNPDEIESKIVFSSLAAEIAREIEGSFAEAGKIVISKTKVFRMDEDVPLLVLEINPNHLDLLKIQKQKRGWKGCIITDPNCTTIGLVLPLKPILDNFGLNEVIVTTMQALSGAGFPGVASLSIADNVIPFISGEEEKVRSETLKILGNFNRGKVENAKIKISAVCTRVPVTDGHIESVHLKTDKDASIEEFKKVLKDFRGLPQELKLPSAPEQPIIVREENDRPQPKLDRNSGKGMSTTVGRIKKNDKNEFSFVLLSHNLVRGAAGSGILDAEFLYKTRLLEEIG